VLPARVVHSPQMALAQHVAGHKGGEQLLRSHQGAQRQLWLAVEHAVVVVRGHARRALDVGDPVGCGGIRGGGDGAAI